MQQQNKAALFESTRLLKQIRHNYTGHSGFFKKQLDIVIRVLRRVERRYDVDPTFTYKFIHQHIFSIDEDSVRDTIWWMLLDHMTLAAVRTAIANQQIGGKGVKTLLLYELAECYKHKYPKSIFDQYVLGVKNQAAAAVHNAIETHRKAAARSTEQILSMVTHNGSTVDAKNFVETFPRSIVFDDLGPLVAAAEPLFTDIATSCSLHPGSNEKMFSHVTTSLVDNVACAIAIDMLSSFVFCN